METEESRPVCIAGLGNPGVRYASTPHNIGFLVLDELARRNGISISKSDGKALVGEGQIAGKPVILVKSKTFMNSSGEGIEPVLKYRNLTERNLIVVYDELDLPMGALRIKKSGSAAGHNGVKSIISVLKTDVFTRVRVGIHPGFKPADAAEYVLAPFKPGRQAEVNELVSYTAEAVEFMVAEGADKTMAKFNRRAQGSKEEEA
jgi:peptidyl-tRNA hydrolase, PTH1 family